MGVFEVLFYLQFVPYWIFIVPLVIFISIAIHLRQRRVLKHIFLGLSILVALAAIPPCAVQAYLDSSGNEALERRFPSLVETARVRSYHRCIAGLGDTLEFWKVTRVDAQACQRIAAEGNLKVQPSSRRPLEAPLWWPWSAKTFTVYEGGDKFGGSTEIWMAEKGSTAYLYRFTE